MKKINLLIAGVLLSINVQAQSPGGFHGEKISVDENGTIIQKPRYQGVIKEVLQSGEYTYLLIDEKTPGYDPKKLQEFWIVVSSSSAKLGDYVRFKKELVTNNYTSKILNKTFDELMFAGDLEYKVQD